MILELADIRIHPGQQAAFDEAIQRGIREVISKAKGFQGFTVNKGIESPERYLLQIFWGTLENHTVDFRQSPPLPTGAPSSARFSPARPRWSISTCWPNRTEISSIQTKTGLKSPVFYWCRLAAAPA
jgi:heme-degrading monooxygenase HmoA